MPTNYDEKCRVTSGDQKFDAWRRGVVSEMFSAKIILPEFREPGQSLYFRVSPYQNLPKFIGASVPNYTNLAWDLNWRKNASTKQ